MEYSPWAQDPCILFVDADDRLRRLARNVLEREGFKVLTARNSVEALVVAADYPFAIDMLLADAGLRVYQNGLELAECFAILRPETRVVLTWESGACAAELKTLAKWDLFAKPLEAGSLPIAVKRALRAEPAASALA